MKHSHPGKFRLTSMMGLLPLVTMLALLLAAGPAWALKPITLTGEQDWIDLTQIGEIYESRGDTLNIDMAPAADGATARMAVRASIPGASPSWIAFALSNPTNKAIELWLTADRYSPVGAGIIWPDLDARRINAVAYSAGFAPERVKNDRVDIFRITIEKGQTITYVAELASERLSRIMLWKPVEFEQRQRERQLFNGIMLGITGLLAVFLTAVFAANHKSIFPMAGLVAWCALALLCVDFGFWHKLFQMKPEDNGQYRAAAEAALAASLVIFLAAFLRVNLWSAFARTLFLIWIAAQLAVVGIAVLDPRLAATVARMSLGLIGGIGFALIVVLAVRGLDRALALIPTWIIFLVWLFGASVTLAGRMSGDFAISGLVSGLVLIVVLIGFTVTQYAFRSSEPVLGAGPGGQQLRLAAMDRAGVAFWEWNIRRDELRLDPEIEAALGLGPGQLPASVDAFLAYVHPADRERFKLELAAIREREGGTLAAGIRLRHADSSYRWLEFEGASVPTSDRRNLRCVGLVRDTTDQKRAQERLLHNAVHDSLTSLPNRELFLDRLAGVLRRTAPGVARPLAVMVIDIDRFRSVNSSFGLVVGDSIILTVSRRIARVVGSDRAMARIGGDQFALFVVDHTDVRELAGFAERIRLSLRSPIRIAGQEIVLTGSIGMAIDDGSAESARDLLRDAEIAMHRAKRLGSDRAEVFNPDMKTEKAERAELERDLAQAIDERKLQLLYQPIVALSNDELIGFEAVVRWTHPRLGVVSPAEFLPLAERSDLVARLGSFVLGRAMADILRWQQELPRPEHPLFVSVGLSSRYLLSPDLIQEVRQARARTLLPAGTLKLAIPESVVMDNPEQASHVLEMLRDSGVELWMDQFGTGYSSLAYLGRFPFDAFRIDKALVEWSAQGERDAAMVRSIVAVAHELGRKIIGDGVSTPEDAAFLRSIGCQYAQGFHYGEPMAEDELVRLLRLIRKSERRMRRRGLVRGQEKKKTDSQAGAADETVPANVVGVPARPQVSTGQPVPPGRAAPSGPPTGPGVPAAVRGGLARQPMPSPLAQRPAPVGGPPTGPMAAPVNGDFRGRPAPVQGLPPLPPAPPVQPAGIAQPPSGLAAWPPPAAAPAPPAIDDLGAALKPSPPFATDGMSVAPTSRGAPSMPAASESVSIPTAANALPDDRRPRPAGDGSGPARPLRPQLRRASAAALSPAVAASLARLAGKADKSQSGGDGGSGGDGSSPPSPGIKAAE
ncbi:MAG: EAL domain-containing protein [Proteobacteria bacterium]|nr:EAL domain-containing protein [Pseudomonadota bacterium]